MFCVWALLARRGRRATADRPQMSMQLAGAMPHLPRGLKLSLAERAAAKDALQAIFDVEQQRKQSVELEEGEDGESWI